MRSMKIIKSYKLFENDTLIGTISLSESEMYNLNQSIKDYLYKVYRPFGWKYGDDVEFTIPDHGVMRSKYINLLVNGKNIMRKIIEKNNLNTKEQFINFVKSNLENLYHYKSQFFNEVALPTVISNVRAGDICEKKVKQAFYNMARAKKMSISYEDPTPQEDISGIDTKVKIGGKTYTMQIKKMIGSNEEGDKVYIESKSCLNVNPRVNYLCFWAQTGHFLFLKNKNITTSGIFFISPVSNNIDFDYNDVYTNDDELELKNLLKDKLIELKDLQIEYDISGRNIFTETATPAWYRNTGVPFKYESYVSLRISKMSQKIEEPFSVIEDLLKVVTGPSLDWQYSMTIEFGARLEKTTIEQLKTKYQNDFSHVGGLTIHFYKL
jgi:hypothetical protein